MKNRLASLNRLLCSAVIGTACFFVTSGITQARDHDDDYRHHRDNPRERRAYLAHSRSHYVLSYGVGYAGRGYYYGPPSAAYYYEGPSVVYYRTREAAPREYWAPDRDSSGIAVQRALARRGYYSGPIDGAIGPMSRRAISRYQSRHGLRVTGTITSGLLRSLKLN